MSGKYSKLFAVRKQIDDEERGAQESQLPQSQPPESQPPNLPTPSHESRLSQSQSLDNRPQESQPPQDQLNILSALPNVGGHLEFPHQITDHLFRHLDPFEQAIYFQLYRLSWGHHKSRCIISNERLGERTNISLSKVKTTVKTLVSKGLIKKVASPHGLNVIQGVEYEVYAPSWQMERSQSRQGQPRESQLPQTPNKEKLLKENEKLDCPDCFGTGFWYPEGTSKGVKRCRHERAV